MRAREILADALYEVFRGTDDGTRAIRDGIFRYWNGSARNRARSMALLSGPREPPAGVLARVPDGGRARRRRRCCAARSTSRTLAGRVRSLVGLGKKVREKLGLVARGVREGSLR